MTAPYCESCKHHLHAPGRCAAQPNGGVVCCDCKVAAPPRSPEPCSYAHEYAGTPGGMACRLCGFIPSQYAPAAPPSGCCGEYPECSHVLAWHERTFPGPVIPAAPRYKGHPLAEVERAKAEIHPAARSRGICLSCMKPPEECFCPVRPAPPSETDHGTVLSESIFGLMEEDLAAAKAEIAALTKALDDDSTVSVMLDEMRRANEAKAEIARLLALIKDAPHGLTSDGVRCKADLYKSSNCTCWKSRARLR